MAIRLGYGTTYYRSSAHIRRREAHNALQHVNRESREEVLHRRELFRLSLLPPEIAPELSDQHARHIARPELDTFLLCLPTADYDGLLNSEGRMSAVDLYSNSIGLEHIQRLVLVDCSPVDAEDVYDDVQWMIAERTHALSGCAAGLARTKNLKRVLLVPEGKRERGSGRDVHFVSSGHEVICSLQLSHSL
jgi:hypothetical protein